MHTDRKRTTVLDVNMFLICMFPLLTMLSDNGIINKVMFAGLVGAQVALFFSNPIKRNTFSIIFALALHYLFVLIVTEYPLTNSNLLFYYPYFIFFSFFITEHLAMMKRWIIRSRKFIYGVLKLWTILVAVSIFLPSSYHVKEGGALYFGSFCGSIFRLGPSAVMIQSMALICQTVFKDKKALLYMGVPMFCYYTGSSRTYLLVGLCILAVSWYMTTTKKMFWSTAIPLAGMLFVLIMISPLGEKIRYTLDEKNYGDFWFRITSSRSVLWAENLSHWNGSSVLKRLCGNGIDFTYDTTGHWGHNDFVEILCSFGLLGILTYCYAVYYMVRNIWKDIKVPFVVVAGALGAWFFNAMLNMFYTYFCAMLAFPIMLLAIREKYEDAKTKERLCAD